MRRNDTFEVCKCSIIILALRELLNNILCTLQIRFGVLRMLCRDLQERRDNKSNPRAKSILCFPVVGVSRCGCVRACVGRLCAMPLLHPEVEARA